jgi:gamma-glutamyl-gamma-aminobutyrate hydrolase PuuD
MLSARCLSMKNAVRGAGGEPVRIELDLTPAQVMKQIENCDAVLLPGSRADVDPQKYGAERHEKTAPADGKRDAVDGCCCGMPTNCASRCCASATGCNR